MLDDRKAAVLRAVVESYIETAEPVGSGHVVRHSAIGVSPATVRNEMAILEKEGYLAQPHTSAGRIPTEKAYRHFVDGLVAPGTLDQSREARVRDFFTDTHGELEQLFHDTTRLLSNLTQHAALVVDGTLEVATVRSVQLVSLTDRQALLVVVLSNGSIEKASIECGADIGASELERAARALENAYRGLSLAARPTIDVELMPAVSELVDSCLGAIGQMGTEDTQRMYVGGAAAVVASLGAVDTVREVLTVLERQLVVVSLLRDVLDRGMRVAIGSETGDERLSECSLVVAPYDVAGTPAGTIAVLGPTRMNYAEALSAVGFVSSRLSQHLSE